MPLTPAQQEEVDQLKVRRQKVLDDCARLGPRAPDSPALNTIRTVELDSSFGRELVKRAISTMEGLLKGPLEAEQAREAEAVEAEAAAVSLTTLGDKIREVLNDFQEIPYGRRMKQEKEAEGILCFWLKGSERCKESFDSAFIEENIQLIQWAIEEFRTEEGQKLTRLKEQVELSVRTSLDTFNQNWEEGYGSHPATESAQFLRSWLKYPDSVSDEVRALAQNVLEQQVRSGMATSRENLLTRLRRANDDLLTLPHLTGNGAKPLFTEGLIAGLKLALYGDETEKEPDLVFIGKRESELHV